VQLVVDRGLDIRRVDAVLHVGLDLELAGQGERMQVGADVIRQLVLVHQALVEAGGLAVAQHAGGKVQLDGVVGAELRHHPGADQARLGHVVVLDALGRFGQGRDPGLLARHRRPGGDVAEIPLRLFPGLGHGNVDAPGSVDPVEPRRVGREGRVAVEGEADDPAVRLAGVA